MARRQDQDWGCLAALLWASAQHSVAQEQDRPSTTQVSQHLEAAAQVHSAQAVVILSVPALVPAVAPVLRSPVRALVLWEV